MDLNQQIELMHQVRADRLIGQEMYARFVGYASDSPITGERETTIVTDFLAKLQELNELYKEVLLSCAEWIGHQ